MAESSVAGIITAVGVVITALGGFLLALGVVIPQLRRMRQAVNEVHTIVNQQRTDSVRYQAALVRELVKHGIEVPIDQSVAPNEDEDDSAQAYPGGSDRKIDKRG